MVGQVDGHLQYQAPEALVRRSGRPKARAKLWQARSCVAASSIHAVHDPRFPAPLDVPYSWRDPGRPIELYTGELELLDKQGRLAQGAGVVSLNWGPQPAVLFTIPDQALRREIGERPRLRIRPLDLRADVHLSSWNRLRGDIKGIINRAPFPATQAIRELRFLVANLPFFTGNERLWEERPLPDGGMSRTAWAGRLTLEGGGWRLVLDSRSDEKETMAGLKEGGGCEVTHTASLRRRDGKPFSDADARDGLLACAHFLGLIAGRWAPPVAAVGLDVSGSIVWRDWNPPNSSPWRTPLHALDERHPEALVEAFAGFMRAWKDGLWGQPLLYAIQMYVEANGPVYAETSLVLAQAALELISWVRFVEELSMFTPDEFEKVENKASGRLRELLGWLDVDPEIPGGLGALAKEARRQQWTDGPHAIDAMRNALVHPSKRFRLEDTDVHARFELNDSRCGTWSSRFCESSGTKATTPTGSACGGRALSRLCRGRRRPLLGVAHSRRERAHRFIVDGTEQPLHLEVPPRSRS